MYTTARSVTRNGNPGGPAQAGSQPISSRQGVGRETHHAPIVGAGNTATAWLRLEAPSRDPRRSVGGQASLPAFFGLRLADTVAPTRSEVTVRTTEAKAVPSAQALDLTRTFPPLARSYDPSFDEVQYQAWLDEILAANRVWQALQDAVEYGDARPSTPAMQATARAAALRDEREWSEYADLVAFYPTLPYGCVETACALND